MNFYNENDPYAAQWLDNLIAANLIPGGKVDRRSIRDIKAEDIRDAVQCHWFGGIGGWPLALRLAGWPPDEPVWTGSAPCQPFSAAGRQEGFDDERDLYPDFSRLIRECRPPVVFGEQVANAVGFGWFDRVCADLEAEGYAVGALVLGAHSVGAPHIRKRLYWVAHSKDASGGIGVSGTETGTRENGKRWIGSGGGMSAGRLGESIHQRLERYSGNGNGGSESGRLDSESSGSVAAPGGDGDRMDHAGGDGRGTRRDGSHGQDVGIVSHTTRSDGRLAHTEHDGGGGLDESWWRSQGRETNFWSDYDLVPCSDGKARRVEPGIQPLAYGVPARVGKLRAYGNAIVPQVAAEFIRAFMEIRNAIPE